MSIPFESHAIHASICIWLRHFSGFRLPTGLPNKPALRAELLKTNGIACNLDYERPEIFRAGIYIQNQPAEILAAAVDRCLAEL